MKTTLRSKAATVSFAVGSALLATNSANALQDAPKVLVKGARIFNAALSDCRTFVGKHACASRSTLDNAETQQV